MPVMRSNSWIPSVFNDLFDADFMPRANATADFNVHINDEGNLIIKMESKSEKKDEDKNVRYLRREFSYTKYEQTLILPDDVNKEQIAAKVENGVLTVDLPRIVEEKVKVSRQISID